MRGGPISSISSIHICSPPAAAKERFIFGPGFAGACQLSTLGVKLEDLPQKPSQRLPNGWNSLVNGPSNI